MAHYVMRRKPLQNMQVKHAGYESMSPSQILCTVFHILQQYMTTVLNGTVHNLHTGICVFCPQATPNGVSFFL